MKIKLHYSLVTLIILMVSHLSFSQVTTSPAFIPKGYKGEIKIFFDPAQGNKGMVGATECYAHTGLITTESTNGSDWKYATPKWLDTSAKYKMTKEGNLWVLTIQNIYTYYGCPETEEILKMAFVFNDGKEGGKEGKTADGKDIFIELIDGNAFSVKFDNPKASQLMAKGETCNFVISASKKSTISLIINNSEVATTEGTSLNYTHTFGSTDDYVCIAKATTTTDTAYDTINICIPAEAVVMPRPEGLQDGITYSATDNTTATLSFYAKDINQKIAQNIFVVGDFNNWTYSSEYQMKRDANTGYFWLDIKGLTPEKEYVFQYAVIRADGSKVQVSDPYTEKVIDNDCDWIPEENYPGLQRLPLQAQGPAAVLQTAQKEYTWSDATLNFKRPNKNNLIIYEVWIYDFSPYRTIAGLTKRLDYIANLGVNAIELMPVCEFEGNISWGYNPTHYFAFDKAYGTKDDFKTFVDECHKRGIAVILDMVFNHSTGLNPMNKLFPLKENPFFNAVAPHSYKIFEDFNHEFEVTNRHFTRALNYWLTEYKVDGFRMDVSHGLCGYNCNNIVGIIDGYYKNGVQSVASDAYFILEHWPWEDGRGESERQDLVSKGMMCWTNINNAYSQTAMGWLKDGDDLTPATFDGFVTYCGSHDEERNFYKAKRWGKDKINTDSTTRLNRIAANMAMNVMLNGPQMIWQFDEIGYDYSINYNSYNGKEEEAGRTSPKPMPEAIGYLQSPLRMNQYQRLAQIIQLRTKTKASVFEGNPKWQEVKSGKQLRSVIWGEGINTIFVISNLDATETLKYNLPTDANEWYDYLENSKMATAKGTEQSLKPGEVKVWTAQYIELPTVPNKYVYTDTIISGTEDVEQEIICTVYPTITADYVNVESDKEPQQISVINLMGQALLNQSGHNKRVNVSSLPQGMYILIISYENEQKAVKIYRK